MLQEERRSTGDHSAQLSGAAAQTGGSGDLVHRNAELEEMLQAAMQKISELEVKNEPEKMAQSEELVVPNDNQLCVLGKCTACILITYVF